MIIKEQYDRYLESVSSLSNKSRKEYRSAVKRLNKKMGINIFEYTNMSDINNILENHQAFRELNKKEGHVFSAAIAQYKDLLTIHINYDQELLEEIDKEDPLETFYYEGNQLFYYGKRYERNEKSRKNAIKIHGTNCKVCDFNFREVYGEFGEGFIEIHHVHPLSLNNKEVKTNPNTDLVPVCSNCHRMLHHKKNRVLSIDELKVIINRS